MLDVVFLVLGLVFGSVPATPSASDSSPVNQTQAETDPAVQTTGVITGD